MTLRNNCIAHPVYNATYYFDVEGDCGDTVHGNNNIPTKTDTGPLHPGVH
jgi:hypothetical protein